jgi:hypothetical protein
MSKTDTIVFQVLHVVAWIIFVGLCIEAGALIVNFVFSLLKPEFIQNLYEKLDLSALFQQSSTAYFMTYSFILSIAILKAYLFYILITLLYKMDIQNPFNEWVAQQITKLAYYTLSIGLLSYISRTLLKRQLNPDIIPERLHDFWADGQGFLLMGAVIYVIAAIFKKGIQLQQENDLTI